MTIELWLLIGSAVWTAALVIPIVIGRMQSKEIFAWAVGNREGSVTVPAWAGRAERAHRNMVENLPLFAIATLVVHVTNSYSAATAYGAWIFVVARVLHGVVYLAGITHVRTLVFMASLAGIAVMISSLF